MAEKKTSPSSWKKQVVKALANLNPDDQTPQNPKRVALLGIGNPLNGDDAVGVVTAEKLISLNLGLNPPKGLDLKVINAGPIPENFSGVLRRYSPDLIIMLDAAQLGEAPGFIRWISLEEIEGFSASTHGMSLTMLTTYLLGDLTCQIGLIGIQPGDTTPGFWDKPNLTPAVKKAAVKIGHFFAEQFTRS